MAVLCGISIAWSIHIFRNLIHGYYYLEGVEELEKRKCIHMCILLVIAVCLLITLSVSGS